jgi:hypothetical protein
MSFLNILSRRCLASSNPTPYPPLHSLFQVDSRSRDLILLFLQYMNRIFRCKRGMSLSAVYAERVTSTMDNVKRET